MKLEEVGTIHLDLHGENIFLDISKKEKIKGIDVEMHYVVGNWDVKILDFGESRADDLKNIGQQEVSF